MHNVNRFTIALLTALHDRHALDLDERGGRVERLDADQRKVSAPTEAQGLVGSDRPINPDSSPEP